MQRAHDALHRSISTAIRAYAAGDAFGVHYEFKEIKGVTSELLTLEGWPFGGVSDDTSLSLLTLATLNQKSTAKSSENFLHTLKEAAPTLRGLGPTTRHALGMSVKETEVHLIGKSNGAMMRTALSGLAFTVEDSDQRREFVDSLARATHSSDEAILAAQIAAALMSHAIDDTSTINTSEIIESELKNFTLSKECSEKFSGRGKWSPPSTGISLDPIETLFAFTLVADRNQKVLDAYVDACSLGGDTDTVSALAGALVAARNPETSEFESIPWLDQIGWDEISEIGEIIDLVYEKRNAR
jgi:ADP-ribosylglycohydrolase